MNIQPHLALANVAQVSDDIARGVHAFRLRIGGAAVSESRAVTRSSGITSQSSPARELAADLVGSPGAFDKRATSAAVSSTTSSRTVPSLADIDIRFEGAVDLGTGAATIDRDVVRTAESWSRDNHQAMALVQADDGWVATRIGFGEHFPTWSDRGLSISKERVVEGFTGKSHERVLHATGYTDALLTRPQLGRLDLHLNPDKAEAYRTGRLLTPMSPEHKAELKAAGIMSNNSWRSGILTETLPANQLAAVDYVPEYPGIRAIIGPDGTHVYGAPIA